MIAELPPAAPTIKRVPEGHLRVAPLQEIPHLLRHAGVDPAAFLSAAGFPLETFDDPDHTLLFEQVGELVQRFAIELNCPHTGLLICRHASMEVLGAVDQAMSRCATVGQALEAMIRHLHQHDRGAAPTWSVTEDTVSLGYQLLQSGVPATQHIHDGALTVAVRIMRALCGPGWVPHEALFARRPPGDLHPYREIFRCKLRFNAEFTAILFPRQTLALPLLPWRRAPGIYPEDGLEEEGLTMRLRRLLPSLLVGGDCSLELACQRLGLHPRALNRRLTEEQTSFRPLLEQARFVRAQQLMANTDLSLGEIAASLGYSEASAFSRAFRRWTGMAPITWRS